ncbi:ribosome biogenesis protein Urb1 [Schizosaccharomyces cryophilus OY26]|uniref:Ribosome biogenesis protein Urb1 n=1 Tax=Schizosaccharomyces cryophilus (strain OY26 / ATCC MYA-4695 / CBS 11777 / NBRC 106824 / NRRL Y48691) TaxID=653667 RepID=S9X803_SCHCR|nr:ribosome biogenesis protein Urb1 [Schizosaccharomyces cryophilus OY26]EPY49846.1 ribosome biogenesis protein Urb1 [Schizosaccharomyces cryophilus OY26]
MDASTIDLDAEIRNLGKILIEHPAHVEKVLHTLELDNSALRYIDAILNSHIKQLYRNLSSNSPLHTLSTLRAMASWNNGVACSRVFQAFDWSSKVFTKMLQLSNQMNSSKRNVKRMRFASSKKRSSFIFLLITLIRYGTQEVRTELINTKNITTPLFKGICNDEPIVLKDLLQTWLTYIILDRNVNRATKIFYFNEWSLNCILSLYSREEEINGVPLYELVHKFFLRACTVPGEGLCFFSMGWHAPLKFEANKSVYNRVLQSLLPSLHIYTDPLQRELCLKILSACPDISASFLERNSLNTEATLSSQWICFTSFLQTFLNMDLPEPFFHPETKSTPSIHSIVENVLPASFSKPLMLKALNSSDKLVCYLGLNTLLSAFKRLKAVLATIDKSELSSERKISLTALITDVISNRLPDAQLFIQLYTTSKQELLTDAVSKVILYFYLFFPETVLKLKISSNVFLGIDFSSFSIDRPFSRSHLQSIVQILQFLPDIKWFELSNSPFIFLTSLYLRSEYSQLKDAVVKVLEDALAETDIVSPCLLVSPIIPMLQALEAIPGEHVDSVLQYANACINRCTSRVYAYLDASISYCKESLLDYQDGMVPPFSPISIVLVEQVPFLLKDTSVSQDAKLCILSWIFKSLIFFGCCGESFECLSKLFKGLISVMADYDFAASHTNAFSQTIEKLAGNKELEESLPNLDLLSSLLLTNEDSFWKIVSTQFSIQPRFALLYFSILLKKLAILLINGKPDMKPLLGLLSENVQLFLDLVDDHLYLNLKNIFSSPVNLQSFVMHPDYTEFNLQYADLLYVTDAFNTEGYISKFSFQETKDLFNHPREDDLWKMPLLAKYMELWSHDQIGSVCQTIDLFIQEHTLFVNQHCCSISPVLSKYISYVSTCKQELSEQTFEVLLKNSLTQFTELSISLSEHICQLKERFSEACMIKASETLESVLLEGCDDIRVNIICSLINTSSEIASRLWKLFLSNRALGSQLCKEYIGLYSVLAQKVDTNHVPLNEVEEWCTFILEMNREYILNNLSILAIAFPMVSLGRVKPSLIDETMSKLSEDYLPYEIFELLRIITSKNEVSSSKVANVCSDILLLLTRVFSSNDGLDKNVSSFVDYFGVYLVDNSESVKNVISKTVIDNFLESTLRHLQCKSILEFNLKVLFSVQTGQCNSSKILQMILAHEGNPLLLEDSSNDNKSLIAATICKLTIMGNNYSLSIMDQIIRLFKGRYTLHDSILCELLRYMEERLNVSIASRYKGWVITNDEDVITMSIKDRSSVLEPRVALESIHHYPSDYIPIQLESLQNLEICEKLLKASEFEWNEKIYHPLFALGVVGALYHTNPQVSNMQVILQQHFFGLILMGLSLHNEQLRAASFHFIQHFLLGLEDQKLRERHLVKLVLSSVIVNVSSPSQRLSTLMANFYAQSISIIMRPSHHMFLGINRYFLQRQHIDTADIPMFYELLYPSSDYTKCLSWLLSLLLAGLQKGEDLKLYLRRHVFETISTLYESCVVNKEIREAISKILLRVEALGAGGILKKHNAVYSLLQLLPQNENTLQSKSLNIAEA